MRTISIRIEFDSLVEDGSYDAVEQITQALAMITASMMNWKILIDHYKKKESLVRGFSFWAKKYP